MKILLSSHVFYPSVGGIESISMLLAESLVARGHQIVVFTQTPSSKDDNFTFEVIRQPTHTQALKTIQWADIVFHSNITLKNIWPLLIIRKPWIVTHQTWITDIDGKIRFRDIIKRVLLFSAKCISISTAVQSSIESPSLIIPNSYDDNTFRQYPEIEKSKDLVFMGRLVSDKGADILIRALSLLKEQHNLCPSTTVIGSGPEEENLQQLTGTLGLQNQIEFTGPLRGNKLAESLSQHKIMIVPSRWNEPFGIVALEGIACGCYLIGSEGGGLRDAIGKCGSTFPNGDEAELAKSILKVVSQPPETGEIETNRSEHLRRHKPQEITKKYEQLFQSKCGPNKVL